MPSLLALLAAVPRFSMVLPDAASAGAGTDFIAMMRRLEQRLGGALPGAEAQKQMAPASRPVALAQQPAGGPDEREAGVLALLYPEDNSGRPLLLLTERQDHLDDHGGQISFPGGQREAGESLEETALREAREEVALDSGVVRVLGPLTPLYIPPSRFRVYPFVGVAEKKPALHPADAEVAQLLHVPLAALLSPGALTRAPWTLHGRTVEVPFFDVEGVPPIWGATSMMLAELLALF